MLVLPNLADSLAGGYPEPIARSGCYTNRIKNEVPKLLRVIAQSSGYLVNHSLIVSVLDMNLLWQSVSEDNALSVCVSQYSPSYGLSAIA